MLIFGSFLVGKERNVDFCSKNSSLKTQKNSTMLTIKAGEVAGKIWHALNENGTLSGKELKKQCGKLTDKDLFLGLGWLLREEKIETAEIEKDITVKLK